MARIRTFLMDWGAGHLLDEFLKWVFTTPAFPVKAGAAIATAPAASAFVANAPWHIAGITYVFWAILVAVFIWVLLLLAKWLGFSVRYSTSTSVSNQILFQNKSALSKAYPLRATMERADVVWGLWVTGSLAYSNDVHNIKSLERILLPNPDGLHASLVGFGGRERKEIEQQVMDLSKRAARAGKEVRWFQTPMTTPITIYNPYSADGWAQIDIPITHATEATNRPVLIVRKAENPELFTRVVEEYQQLWKTAKPENVAGIESR